MFCLLLARSAGAEPAVALEAEGIVVKAGITAREDEVMTTALLAHMVGLHTCRNPGRLRDRRALGFKTVEADYRKSIKKIDGS